MKIVSVVPIKLNSERTPGKNLKQFSDGTPLCRMLFGTLAKVNGIDEKYCFCSSEKIKDYLPDGIEFLKRSERLDTPQTHCQDILREFFKLADADIYVLAHVTSPFLKAITIERCIDMVVSGKYDSAFTAERLNEFLWSDNQPLNFDIADNPRTQDLKPIFRETSGCYVFTKDVFLKSSRRVGFNPYLCEISAIEAVDIDYPEDFEIADAIYTHLLKTGSAISKITR